MAKLTRRRLIASALIGGICLPQAARAAPAFAPHPGVKAAITARQSGIFDIASLGQIQTLLLLIDGTPVELHAVRNGIYQPKAQAHAQSSRVISPLDFNRLITAAGGTDHGVGGTLRAPGFRALYDGLKAGAVIGRNAPAETVPTARLSFSPDPFFADWTFTYDPQRALYAVTVGALRALWTLEGQP